MQMRTPSNVKGLFDQLSSPDFIQNFSSKDSQDLFAIRKILEEKGPNRNRLLTRIAENNPSLFGDANSEQTRSRILINLLKENYPCIAVGDILKDIMEEKDFAENTEMEMAVFAEFIAQRPPHDSSVLHKNLQYLLQQIGIGQLESVRQHIYLLAMAAKQGIKEKFGTPPDLSSVIQLQKKLALAIKDSKLQDINTESINIVKNDIKGFLQILLLSQNVESEEKTSIREFQDNLNNQTPDELYKKFEELLFHADPKVTEFLKNALVLSKLRLLNSRISPGESKTIAKDCTNSIEELRAKVRKYCQEIKAKLDEAEEAETQRSAIRDKVSKYLAPEIESKSTKAPVIKKLLERYGEGGIEYVPQNNYAIPAVVKPEDLDSSGKLKGNEKFQGAKRSYTISQRKLAKDSKGAVGDIRYAQDNRGNWYVIKTLLADLDQDEFGYQNAINEYKIAFRLNKTDEEMIEEIKPIGERFAHIILKYENGYDLRDILGHRRGSNNKPPPFLGKLKDNERFIIAQNILNAYNDLHKKGIYQRDISPGNIRINPITYKVSFIDFGASLEHKEGTVSVNDTTGAPSYIYPETLVDQTYTVKQEIYPIGIILKELLLDQQADIVERNKVFSQIDEGQSTGFAEDKHTVELLEKMTDPDPSKRPSLKEAISQLKPLSEKKAEISESISTNQMAILKSNKESSPPAYITLYVFTGTAGRGGVGHVALWDGYNYFSYGLNRQNDAWVEDKISTESSSVLAVGDSIAKKEMKEYGTYTRIILPVTEKVTEEFAALRDKFKNNPYWGSDKYSVQSRNCAHMVEEYLISAGYMSTEKILDPIIPLCPSEIATKAGQVGTAMVAKIIERCAELGLGECRDYIDELSQASPDVPRKVKAALAANYPGKLNAERYRQKFIAIFKIIAQKHYSNAAPRDFYAIWFTKALEEVCKVKSPSIEKQSDFNTFMQPRVRVYRDMYAIVIAVIPATVIATVLAIGAIITGLLTAPLAFVGLLFTPRTDKAVFLDELSKNPRTSYIGKKIDSFKKWYYELSDLKKAAFCIVAAVVIVGAGIMTGGTIYAAVAGGAVIAGLTTGLTLAGGGILAAGIGAVGVFAVWLGVDIYKYSMFKRSDSHTKVIGATPEDEFMTNSRSAEKVSSSHKRVGVRLGLDHPVSPESPDAKKDEPPTAAPLFRPSVSPVEYHNQDVTTALKPKLD